MGGAACVPLPEWLRCDGPMIRGLEGGRGCVLGVGCLMASRVSKTKGYHVRAVSNNFLEERELLLETRLA